MRPLARSGKKTFFFRENEKSLAGVNGKRVYSFRDPCFKKNLPAALMPIRPTGLRVIEILKSSPTGAGDHQDALRPLPISAGYVAGCITCFSV